MKRNETRIRCVRLQEALKDTIGHCNVPGGNSLECPGKSKVKGDSVYK